MQIPAPAPGSGRGTNEKKQVNKKISCQPKKEKGSLSLLVIARINQTDKEKWQT